MNFFLYVKKNGFVRTFEVIYKYKLDKFFLKIAKFLTRGKLENVILIESHNDFDCNGGAFYDYLISNNYNKKYKIVWLLKNKLEKKLPYNVYAFYIDKPSFIKNYYIATAKYMTADNYITAKVYNNQKSFYFTHGGVTFKNVKGIININNKVDYVLSASEYYDPFVIENYSIENPEKKMLHVGFPSNDYLFNNTENELRKITDKEFFKTILWMPTFRKGGGENRNDSLIEQKLGIPLIETEEEYEALNTFFQQNNSLLIIKLHPLQDMDSIKISNLSNIMVLTGESVKKLNLDNTRLMKYTDALVSDYSSVAFQYLLLNRPIGFILSDLDSYKLGFSVSNIDEFLVGHKIYTYNDFISFVSEILVDNDKYQDVRTKLLEKLYKYRDGDSSKRIADFMGL